MSSGKTELALYGYPHVERAVVYNKWLSHEEFNQVADADDDYWYIIVKGESFGWNCTISGNGQSDTPVTVDWGDGTVETSTVSKLFSHTFTNGGGYHKVGFKVDGTRFYPRFYNTTSPASDRNKIIAMGPIPLSMDMNMDSTTQLANAVACDFAGAKLSGCSAMYGGYKKLRSMPYVDTSDCTGFNQMWYAMGTTVQFLTPTDTSSATTMSYALYGAHFTSHTDYPALNTSNVTNFSNFCHYCNSDKILPYDYSNGTNFQYAFRGMPNFTEWPTGPQYYLSKGTKFLACWENDTGMTTFPAGVFDNWTGTPVNNCFNRTWGNCTSLTATSVENILNSIDTSGQSAPASGVDIEIDYNTGTGTPTISTAVTNLKSRGWTITLNGVAQ